MRALTTFGGVVRLALAATVLCALPARSAPVDRRLNVQGTLATSAGAPAPSPVDLRLDLFLAETGGASQFGQDFPSTTVSGGLFDVVLGPLPATLVATAPELWLQTTAAGQILPRQRLSTVATALHAEHANAADLATAAQGLACSGCVAASQVGFGYAASATKGGAASSLDCTGCVTSTVLAAGSVGSTHVQDGSLSAADVAFAFAKGATKDGNAVGLSCTGCIGSGHLAADLTLAGTVTIQGGLVACQAGAPGCAIGLPGGASIVAAGGTLDLRAGSGVRVQDAGGTALRPIQFAGGQSSATLAVSTGYVTADRLGAGTATPVTPLDVVGAARVSGTATVGGLAGTAQAGFANLIVNGGFEGGLDPLDFCASCSYGPNTLTSDGSCARTGTGGLQQGGGNGEYELSLPGSVIALGRAYTYSAWVRIQPGWTGQTQTLHGRLHYADGSHVAWAGDTPAADGEWHRVSQTFQARADAPATSLSLFVGYPGGQGTRCVDDLSLTEGALVQDAALAAISADGRALIPGPLTVGGAVSLGGNELLNVRLQKATSAPYACTAATEGGIYYDANSKSLRVCDGASWVGQQQQLPLGTQQNPGASCKNIKDAGWATEGDGVYWVDFPHDGIGNAKQVFCDMTRDGGGWNLLFQRGAGNTNVSSSDPNLNTFLHNERGAVSSLGYTASYCSNVNTTPPHEQYLFVQYNSALQPDLDDAYIVHHTGNLFPNTTGEGLTAVSKMCNASNTSCDTTSVVFVYAGDSWYHSSVCYDGYANNLSYRGNYGYCQNGLSGSYNSSCLYGDRCGYDETKLWGHPNIADSWMERVFVR